MPAQECVGLNNEKGLFPEPGTASEQNEAKTVELGYLRSLHLTIVDDQLLAKECIFSNQIRTTAGQV
jgi:hypothetical protein